MTTLNREQIKTIMPHREPMLMVDAVRELVSGQRAEATLYIDPAWDLFRGHFPGDPVLPGVYAVEAMGQTANLMLMTTPAYAGKVPLLLGINSARFRRKIVPGDTLELHAELASERPEKAIVTCRCTASVNGELAAEAEIAIAMR